MDKVQHSMSMAARKSGLTPHVIRVWERRYGAVTPSRSKTNRRLYSEGEIERLTLLRQAVAAGYRIGNIATLDAESLRSLLVSAPGGRADSDSRAGRVAGGESQDFEARCMEAVKRMDASYLEDTLTRALIVFGHQGLVRRVIAPFAQTLGELWAQGTITAAHEHFATAFLKDFLGNSSRSFVLGDGTPSLVVATPTGQLHELGAVMVASAARNQGWRVVYLGASLPAAEIAGAAAQSRARAVALSLVYPTDDPHLAKELADLRRFLPPEISVLAGGRAASAYREALNIIGAIQIVDLDTFCAQLESLRKAPRSPA
jgi:DNA-binding transcriptional MerR regulator/methylmalonyl-CoA mutase cobalamin-binding subunit